MDEHNVPTHIVGIGASAGGLEALQMFLQFLPNDTNASFVIIQHLSPDFKSLMVELLAKHTDMPVLNATDAIEVTANTIYVIPPKKSMLIAEGKLLLSDRPADIGHHLPIDIFFRSLAEDQQHKAIGVVLSGTGSDGCRGVKALKEAGGLVIAQEPTSAKFDGMPISAVNTGLVDLVLPPEQIGPQLNQYFEHPLAKGEQTSIQKELSSSDRTLSEIFNLLKHKSDIDFGAYKASTVARRIERRMTINQIESLQAYLSFLLKTPHEIEILGKELLIGVTRFFRDEETFATLAELVIPEIVQQSNATDPIRTWVAGCSTGEEAYTIAILFHEELRKQGINRTIKIFATDVDADAIAEASTGCYSEEIAHDIPAPLLNQYFTHKANTYTISPEIRHSVIFATHNVISDPPFSNMHLVTCRNLLIYLQQPVQRRVITCFHFALRKEGYLLMGSSESLGELESHFNTIADSRYRLFQKVSNQRIPISSSPIPPTDTSKQTQSTLPPISGVLRNYRKPAQEHGGFVMPVDPLIGEFVPPCILLDDNFDAIHVYGDITNFVRRLAPGKVSVNVNDMMIEDISIAVSTALHRARQTEQDVHYTGVEYNNQNSEPKSLDLSVLRVANTKNKTLPHYYWLILQNTNAPPKPKKKNNAVAFDTDEQTRQRITDLETELKRNREHLQVTIEELETTNEELQSANEELMSANEELQSTNEELQSVNEELFTVNSEYQEKLTEVSLANADLDNVLKLANIGIIFLDDRLSIRRFTPAVTQYIHLVDTDVDRPIHHISAPNGYDNFIQDISEASKDRKLMEKEIVLHDERVILVKIVPHASPSDSNHYAVTITFNDITAIKKGKSSASASDLRKQVTDALATFEHLPPPHKLYVLVVDDDEDSRYILVNNLQSSNFCQYSITVANSAAQARELLQKTDFDICITDFRLGDDTAIELFTQTQDQQNQPPFVVVTNYPEDTLYAKLLSAGITDLISKAEVTPEVISRAVRYAVQKRALVKTLAQQMGE